MVELQWGGRDRSVALLGAAGIGRHVARRLLLAGFELRVWDSALEEALPLMRDGARVVDHPVDAAVDADILLTLVPDMNALRDATAGPYGAFASLPFGAVWVQMGDIGIEPATRARERTLGRVRYVDAPFMGLEQAARDGELMVMASGPESARAEVRPLLDAIARRTLWVDRAGGGSWLKHALGTWVSSLAEGSDERAALSAALGLGRRAA